MSDKKRMREVGNRVCEILDDGREEGARKERTRIVTIVKRRKETAGHVYLEKELEDLLKEIEGSK